MSNELEFVLGEWNETPKMDVSSSSPSKVSDVDGYEVIINQLKNIDQLKFHMGTFLGLELECHVVNLMCAYLLLVLFHTLYDYVYMSFFYLYRHDSKLKLFYVLLNPQSPAVIQLKINPNVSLLYVDKSDAKQVYNLFTHDIYHLFFFLSSLLLRVLLTS